MTALAPPRPAGGPPAAAPGPGPATSPVVVAASRPVADVLADLAVTAAAGLPAAEAGRRLTRYGPNAVASHRARFLPVLWHQLRSPLLGLLIGAATVSFLVGERGSAVIIAVIVTLSVGLGFVNEYRAEKAAESLHSQITHTAVVPATAGPPRWTSPRWCRATSSTCTWATSSRPTSGSSP